MLKCIFGSKSSSATFAFVVSNVSKTRVLSSKSNSLDSTCRTLSSSETGDLCVLVRRRCLKTVTLIKLLSEHERTLVPHITNTDFGNRVFTVHWSFTKMQFLHLEKYVIISVWNIFKCASTYETPFLQKSETIQSHDKKCKPSSDNGNFLAR